MTTRRDEIIDDLVASLTEIRKMAVDHPAFDEEAFTQRNTDSLVEQGGDICDWTMIAILSDDAIRKATQNRDELRKILGVQR